MKDKIIEKYLTTQNYNQLDINNRIYFVKNIGDEYADIFFSKSSGWCGISYELISFFSRMMDVEESDIEEVIGRWVEHTLQMKVKATFGTSKMIQYTLTIPYNNT
jgi:hypothetical protein